ncbi:MAG: SDR family NAD(P)-dependent oxidoreductase, partial [Alphaproteobacteria bacterium]|nr:SDR family NAD(P)-dependent oxidoreductase [Alphaproteobacteria bacterium]
MAGRLEGRVALVTGASSGLGRRFSGVMAMQGARVMLAARRIERLEEAVNHIRQDGGEAEAVACDVTNEASVMAAYDAAEERFGVVDTVVNNAGMTTSATALEQSAEEFGQVLDLNVKSVFIVAREGARRMIRAGASFGERGRIINIASIGARHVLPGVAAYCASKAACAMLTRSLAREWAKHGVNVNSLSPGYVATELNTEWLNSESGQKMLARTARRRVMDASSLDEALLFLASDGAKFVTGADLVV